MITWQAVAWHILGIIVLFVLLGDWDWKRRLFETNAEKWARSPKFRAKQLKAKQKYLEDHCGWPKSK